MGVVVAVSDFIFYALRSPFSATATGASSNEEPGSTPGIVLEEEGIARNLDFELRGASIFRLRFLRWKFSVVLSPSVGR